MNTTNLGLPFLYMSQAQKEVTHNLALTMIDMLMFPVTSATLTSAETCEDGKMYLVGAMPLNVFEGHANQLVLKIEGQFYFIVPRPHMRIYRADMTGTEYRFTGTIWVVA